MRILLALLLTALTGWGATTNQIVQNGVTFQFNSDVDYGQFVSGDYYVVGPVTITNMLPEWSGNDNGWQINCPFSPYQGFDSDVNGYDAALRVAMPFTLSTNSCVVKVIAKTNDTLPAIKMAVVLTVLTSAPPAGGSVTFRPPYSGTTNRPLYTVSDLQTNLLPAYLRSGLTNYPTLATTASNFSRGLMLDFHSYDARRFRPSDVMADYNPENGPLYMEGMLNLFLDDTWAQKSNAVCQYSQMALDRAFLVHQGYQDSGTGHNPGHRVVAAFGATIFNITAIKSYLATNEGFHEDNFLYRSASNNVVLWGQTSGTESQYWSWMVNSAGSRSYPDPYQYIDGGNYAFGAGEYQIITSQFLKGQVLAARLMPTLQSCYKPVRWTNVNEYAERWVNYGGRMSPDPVAPHDSIWANYGVTYGPNGSGSYIAGGGRKTTGGYAADGGQYRSLFVANMWQAYASTPVVPQLSTVTIAANGTTWTLNYTEAVSIGAGGSSGNTASLTLGSVILTYSSGSGSSALVFTGSRTVYSGETGTLNYSQPGDGIQDADGDDVATVTGVPVSNGSTQISPAFGNNQAASQSSKGFKSVTIGNNEVTTSVTEPTADILQYKMNEGSGTTFTADVGPNGTTSGGSGYVTGADGLATHAFNFGGDTTATSDSAITYGVNVITVTFWAYNTAWGTGATPLLSSTSGSSTANTWMIDNDEGTIRCIFRGTTTSLLRYEGFAAPSNSAWHHFAVVFDGSTASGEITVYVDGVVQSTTVNQSDRDGTSNFGAETLYIGNATGPTFWGGYMDDIRIYGSALSAGQIAAVYANPE